jgi:hypothetical protein
LLITGCISSHAKSSEGGKYDSYIFFKEKGSEKEKKKKEAAKN